MGFPLALRQHRSLECPTTQSASQTGMCDNLLAGASPTDGDSYIYTINAGTAYNKQQLEL